jgi:D-alanine-D-alanine ligase|uniref:D-alanine--D-alanine ligase n=1 Tax=Desulfobacca acetoxidans TaxID=60893 RepID=A0A7V6A2H5_9BACT
MAKLRLALIAGGNSAERDVSLKSGEQVYAALDKNRYDISRYDPKYDLERLAHDAANLDVALVIMHGRGGEDGTLQGMLDLLGIPYQGSGVLGSALGMNKELSKMLYQQAGLKVSRALFLNRGEALNPREIAAELGLPVVIKPVHEGSSIGMSKASTPEELEKGMGTAFLYDHRVLVEEFLEGVEVTGGVLGNAELTALPLVEIVPAEQYAFFDYEAKYKPGASTEICPARLDEATTRKAQAAALTAHRALHCRGYSRTDMIVRDGEIYVLETNTIPGMTATSLFPQAAKAYGLEFPQLLDRLIELAMEKG